MNLIIEMLLVQKGCNMKEFYMEDVRSISVDASTLIEERLKEFNIILNPEQEDRIYLKIQEVLEDVSNGDYRNHN